ncbi:uncharacterized protein JCM10292_006252 [Rhodotorula paludigena]|uniref:uncharacterized protein n=1 Tax=Rhodotorula paludigena TaxID=86838 RepID=UPI00316F8D3E
MRFVFLLALLTSFVPALARKPVYQRKINHLLGDIAYIDSKKSIAFTFWIQLVNEPVASQFNKLFKQRDRPMTILIPDNAAWDTYLRDLGRNTTDIESFSDPAMRALFTELYPFFFFEGALDTSDVADGETIILDSWKKSPVGDWPLSIAFRRNTSLGPTGADLEAGTASPYNGTFVSSPYGSGNVEIPNYATDNGCLAQVVPYMPTVPKNLSITIADLGVVGWSEIIKRVPAAASLEISRSQFPPS